MCCKALTSESVHHKCPFSSSLMRVSDNSQHYYMYIGVGTLIPLWGHLMYIHTSALLYYLIVYNIDGVMVLLLRLSWFSCEYIVPSFLSILAFPAISSCISYCNVSVGILLTTGSCGSNDPFFETCGVRCPLPPLHPWYTQLHAVKTLAKFLYVPNLDVTARANNRRFSSQILNKPSPLEFPNCTTFMQQPNAACTRASP